MQWQVLENLIELWEFDTEEEAKAFKVDGKILSNIHKQGDKFVRGWSVVGQTFAETMREAGEFYNFRVDLSADYDIGKNWAECH